MKTENSKIKKEKIKVENKKELRVPLGPNGASTVESESKIKTEPVPGPSGPGQDKQHTFTDSVSGAHISTLVIV